MRVPVTTIKLIFSGVAHAISQSDCLAFDTPTAQLFAENGNLGIFPAVLHVFVLFSYFPTQLKCLLRNQRDDHPSGRADAIMSIN